MVLSNHAMRGGKKEMQTILLMCVGIAIGRWIFPKKWNKALCHIQTVFTVLLIFCMGLSLGKNDGLLSNLPSIGLESLLFCLFPMVASMGLVYLITKKGSKEIRRDR